jgi:hypothetical protein
MVEDFTFNDVGGCMLSVKKRMKKFIFTMRVFVLTLPEDEREALMHVFKYVTMEFNSSRLSDHILYSNFFDIIYWWSKVDNFLEAKFPELINEKTFFMDHINKKWIEHCKFNDLCDKLLMTKEEAIEYEKQQS